jgi:hypothetical protein
MERMSGRTQVNFIRQGRAPARSGVACPINVNHECARIDTNKAVFEIAYLRVLRVFLNLPMASEAAKEASRRAAPDAQERIPTGADGLSRLHRAASSMEGLPSPPTFYCLRAVREQSLLCEDLERL